jgi:hypothetical protein
MFRLVSTLATANAIVQVRHVCAGGLYAAGLIEIEHLSYADAPCKPLHTLIGS